MDNTKLVEALVKDTWFSVNFQHNTSEKIALAIGEMAVASVAGLASYAIPYKINRKLSEKLKEKEMGEKEHFVGFSKEEREEKINEIEKKYRKYEKLNNIGRITAIATLTAISGKTIGHLFTKLMNDLDK